MVRDLLGQGDTEAVSTNSLPTKEARRKGALRQAIAGRGKNGLPAVGMSGDLFICTAEELGGGGGRATNDVEQMNRMRGALHAQHS